MALAGRTLAVSGPPDLLDEEFTFERMAAKDEAIKHDLEEQDASLDGKRGAKLWFMNVDTGEQAGSADLDSQGGRRHCCIGPGICIARKTQKRFRPQL